MGVTKVSKSTLALATYKPSTKAKQRLADDAERRVSSILGGERTDDNSPLDTVLRDARGRTVGVEVKSISDNKNSKITMHPASLERKKTWAEKTRAVLHTVAVDLRGRTPRILHRLGVGSFRLNTMTPVRDGAHLRELVGVK